MDDQDSKKIYDNLQELNNGQEKMFELQNQHIAVLQSNFDALSKPIMQLQNETEEIEDKLNQLIKRSNDQDEFFTRSQTLNQQVAELSSLLLVQCLHINRMQEEATEIVTAIDKGRLHPLIVPYDKISKLLQDNGIQTNNREMNHEVLRQITEVEHTEIEGRILVKIIIPVLEPTEYTLYKPYLIPFKSKNGYRTYEIDADYLAVNKITRNSIELSQDTFKECKAVTEKLETKLKICEHTHPIVPEQSSHCLANLFVNPLNTAVSCKTLPTHPLNGIIKLVNTNTWLYSITDSTDMILECNGTISTLKLRGEGTIQFLSKCRATTKDFTIEVAGKPTTVKLEQPVLPPQSKEEVIIVDTDFSNPPKPSKIKMFSSISHNRDFLHETNKINNLKELAGKINAQRHYQPARDNLYNVTTIGAGLAVILAISVSIYIWKTRNSTKTLNINTMDSQRVPRGIADQIIHMPHENRCPVKEIVPDKTEQHSVRIM